MKRRNVFSFRSLKWGDPKERFKLLCGDLDRGHKGTARTTGLGVIDYALILFASIAALIGGAYLIA